MILRIGVDPGGSGALVALGPALDVLDSLLMPTMKVGTATRVNAAALVPFIERWHGAHAFLEKVHAMPGQGVSSTFTFGHAAGVVEGVILGLGMPLTLVTPQTWKKRAGLIGEDKDAARSRAIQLWPTWRALDAKAKGQALADAALIARFGMEP